MLAIYWLLLPTATTAAHLLLLVPPLRVRHVAALLDAREVAGVDDRRDVRHLQRHRPHEPARSGATCAMLHGARQGEPYTDSAAHTCPGNVRSTSSSMNSAYGTCPLAAARPAFESCKALVRCHSAASLALQQWPGLHGKKMLQLCAGLTLSGRQPTGCSKCFRHHEFGCEP